MKQIAIKDYTSDDYLNSNEPYEFLYDFKNDEFTHYRLIEQISKYAKSKGVQNFKTIYKNYCKTQEKKNNTINSVNITEFEGQEMELDSGKWIPNDFGITMDTQFGEVEACIHPIYPALRLVNIDTDIEKLELKYKKGSRWRSLIVDKKVLASASSIVSLADFGIAVNSENAKHMVKYLHDIENLNYERIPEKNSVTRLGWIDGEGFSPYVPNLVFDGDGNFRTFFDSVQEHGSYKEWLDLAVEIRKGSIYGRLIMAASFASCLVKPLSCLPFFVHLWGETEAGKTVGLMLASSIWANPEQGRFIHTFNSTAVGREKSASFVNSLPLILDELQIVSDKKQFDKDIYMLSEGVGRTRGNKSGGIDKTPTWSNCIITSGEMPITTGASGGGAVNRIVEIECKEKLFVNAREVAETVSKNYGFAGKKFTSWLQEGNNLEIAKSTFALFRNQFEKTDITEKQIMAMSLILTADLLSTQIIFEDNKSLEMKEVVDFLKTKSQVSVHERAYEYLCEFTVVNKNKFDHHSTNEVWGLVDDNFIYFIRSQFTKICEEAGYNSQALLSWLKQNGLIIADKGCTKQKRVSGNSVACVWLKKPDFQERCDEIMVYSVKDDNNCPF